MTYVFILVQSLTAFAAVESMPLQKEEVPAFDLASSCKLVRSDEPRGDLRFKNAHGVMVTRPIYSDLCETKTAQLTNRLYSFLEESGAVIGFSGSNDSSFLEFSGHVLKK